MQVFSLRKVRLFLAAMLVLATALPMFSSSVAQAAGGFDYSLGYYSSGSQGKTEYVQFTYTNPGPDTITDLAGQFDVEAPWTRHALGNRTGGFLKGLRWETVVSGTPSGFTAPGTPLVVNDASATPATTWYDDSTMDSLGGLSIRNVPFSITGLALAPGDSITLRWDGSFGDANHKNILASIDNFFLNDTTGGGSTLLYSQDFDAAGQNALATVGAGNTFAPPAGWAVAANSANQPQLVVSDGTSAVWGGVYTGYYATAPIPPSAGPEPADNILVCDNASIDINFNGITGLNGYEFKVNYDETLVNATGAFDNSWFDAATNTAIPNGYNAQCASGTCQFAVARTDGAVVNGSGTVATIQLSRIAAGTFDLEIVDLILSDIDGFPISVDLDTDVAVTVCGKANVSGVISLQGRTTPIDIGTVTLTDASSTFGPYTTNFDATTGAYSFTDINVLPGGSNYEFLAEHSLYLDNAKTETLSPGSNLTNQNTRLLGGDADNSGGVTIGDLACIGSDFGGAPTLCGDPLSNNGITDINADGVVNILDLSIAGGNYGKSSPQPW